MRLKSPLTRIASAKQYQRLIEPRGGPVGSNAVLYGEHAMEAVHISQKAMHLYLDVSRRGIGIKLPRYEATIDHVDGAGAIRRVVAGEKKRRVYRALISLDEYSRNERAAKNCPVKFIRLEVL